MPYHDSYVFTDIKNVMLAHVNIKQSKDEINEPAIEKLYTNRYQVT